MKHYKASLVVGTVIILGSGWMHYASTSDVSGTKIQSSQAKKVEVVPKTQMQQTQALQPVNKPLQVMKVTKLPPQTVQQREKYLQPLTTQLKQLRSIKAKVFRTEADDVVVKAFIQNPDNLQSLVSLLTDSTSLQATTAAEHQAAVDVLLEAAKTGNSKISQESILTVISDKQVEDQTATEAVRELHAGIKAELMYGAAFIDQRTIQNYVPGPVSQKIWDNVQAAFAENITASESQRRISALPTK